MVAAAAKHQRVVQVGTQSRSAPHYAELINQLRSGRLGKIHQAKAWSSRCAQECRGRSFGGP